MTSSKDALRAMRVMPNERYFFSETDKRMTISTLDSIFTIIMTSIEKNNIRKN